MKIRHVLIENFKSIKRFEHSFVNEMTGEVRPITAIFGDNGSGKTSVLQAIALVVSLATEKTGRIDEFKWHGFVAKRLATLGETYIRLELQLDEEELLFEERVNEFFNHLKDSDKDGRYKNELGEDFFKYPLKEFVILEYKEGSLEISSKVASFVRGIRRTLLARKYPLKEIVDASLLSGQGDVFWCDQYRNLGSGTIGEEENKFGDWHAGVSSLREILINWWFFHQQNKSDDDVIIRLEKAFSIVFPGARFVGTELINPTNTRPKTSDWYFLIERENTFYDISEMSSGEQAVFSMLYDFVSNKVSRSIILIDELELHLHPPEQQALYNALRKIGPDCQFIFTSHSPYLKDIIPTSARIRLEGGRLCL